ncbi:hypothetical protein MJO28_003067 [Puccinia striiformis f. sp. tritici]|uniref:RING-type domain-containing protein n=3 Tax=Puccinia striiformis TaxID=27350 RepID=A0A0L0UXR8_9BASI|nr:hypothetical protein Pst134EA_005012 [Puccinia striiformis f. sp. tritici]KAI9621779.1 hypothetical protein H4Q26_015545 [Puccinia striiformis f. sp. tritici PST-130]KNE91820.1 hypothetical protein PSTG_14780 [Puccinia striiformis f. sp. tritici PST-78]POV95515.1 hypothetical protein PSHT_15622 [Puccinia striiformis]KAH9471104.1 hypothetical protein Pst134EA_005012 [Puccinia striiformis f. sp. tritici]KAI7959276.1 hypothetical protein MJO28_003067 [Puccinia striiformis f. sp. tritici]
MSNMQPTCPICYERIRRDVFNLPCTANQAHQFHTACLQEWFEDQDSASRQPSCPLCRTKYEFEYSSADTPHVPVRADHRPPIPAWLQAWIDRPRAGRQLKVYTRTRPRARSLSPQLVYFPPPAQPANSSTNPHPISPQSAVVSSVQSPVRLNPPRVNEQVGTTYNAASEAQVQTQPQTRVRQISSSNPGSRTVVKPTKRRYTKRKTSNATSEAQVPTQLRTRARRIVSSNPGLRTVVKPTKRRYTKRNVAYWQQFKTWTY